MTTLGRQLPDHPKARIEGPANLSPACAGLTDFRFAGTWIRRIREAPFLPHRSP